jgi:hypothetical protein
MNVEQLWSWKCDRETHTHMIDRCHPKTSAVDIFEVKTELKSRITVFSSEYINVQPQMAAEAGNEIA